MVVFFSVFFFFFQFLRYSWQNYKTLNVCSMIMWYMYILWGYFNRVNYQIYHLTYLAIFIVRNQCLLANFSYKIWVLSSIIIMLCIRSSDLIHLITGSLYPSTGLFLGPLLLSPWQQPLLYSVSIRMMWLFFFFKMPHRSNTM